jgi:hypothetical protein
MSKNDRVAELLPEYELKNKQGVRGKYFKSYREGRAVRIQREDGSVVIQHFTLEDGAVMLEPDVRKHFPDSDAVNAALRTIISLTPKHRAAAKPGKR